MHDSVPQTSKLRQLRQRAGVTAAELADAAGISTSAWLAIERLGRPPADLVRRTRIESALGVVLQRELYRRVGEARAGVTRAEVELEAARAQLDEAEARHELDTSKLRVDIAGLWDEADAILTDEVEPVAA